MKKKSEQCSFWGILGGERLCTDSQANALLLGYLEAVYDTPLPISFGSFLSVIQHILATSRYLAPKS